MEEKESYFPSEVAQMVVAFSDAHKHPSNQDNWAEYESFVPLNVQRVTPMEKILLEEKDSYSPKEITQICLAYFRFYGKSQNTIQEWAIYEESVPANVQSAIANLNWIINDYNSGDRNNIEIRAKEGSFEKLLRLRKIIP
jgi:hypothetical protein